jgi:serine/threonine protein kinase
MEDDKEKESYKPTIPIIRAAPKPPRVPKDFGEYLIKEEVGCGGMGWIFKAVHKKLDVIHALKILHPALSQHEEFLDNFKREAQLAARLQHPNIVIIHNTGEFAGFHYIAMEFIDGDNLAKKLPENGMDPVVVLAIAVKILDALDHAHNYEFSYQGRPYYGLIHRDIKPENIIIDHQGEVKITDFGIARGIHLYGNVTAEGMVVGTLSYMSPEQIDGVEKLSPTTDIYSLGVVIYELLSGKKAFVGNTTTQIIKRISNHEYEPLGRVSHKIPPDIIRIVDRAMSYNSEQRYQSAYEMRVEISRYLSQYQYNDPTTIVKKYFVERIPPSTLRKEKRKKPSAVKPAVGKIAKVFGIIALIAAVLVALFYLNQMRNKHNAEKAISTLSGRLDKSKVNNASIDFSSVFNLYQSAQAKFDSKDYGLTRLLCDSATGILSNMLDSIKFQILSKQAVFVDSTKRAKDLGSPIDFTSLYLDPVNILIGAEEFDQADSLLKVALRDVNIEIRRLTHVPPDTTHHPPPPEKQVARSKLDDAYVQLNEAKKDCPNISFSAESTQIVNAEDLFGKSMFSQSMQITEDVSREIAHKTATQCGIPPEIIQARNHYETLSEAQKQGQNWNKQRMNELVRDGKFDQAKVFANEILKIKPASELVIPAVSPQSDSEYFTLATIYDEKGDYDSALKNYGQVQPAATLMDSRQYYIKARFDMGKIYQEKKHDYKRAIQEYQKVLDLRYPNYYVSCYLNIGECFYELASYDSAIANFEKVDNNKHLIVPDASRGQTSVFQSDAWHFTVFYWAASLTKMCYNEKANPQKKRRLRDEAIRKWENDYLDNFRKDINDPVRGVFVRNAEVYRNSLRSGG